MRAPLAWLAGGLAAGSWWWASVPIGAAALCVVGGLTLRMHRKHPLTWCLIGLGLGVCNGRLQVPTPPVRPHIAGRVRSASGPIALVETTDGIFGLNTHPDRLRPNQWVSAAVSGSVPRRLLPGGWPGHRQFSIGNVRMVRAHQWIASDRTSRPIPTVKPLRRSGVVRALLTGDRSGISERTLSIFRQTGTSHLLAISGMHMGIASLIGGAAGWLASRPIVLLRRARTARAVTLLTALSAAFAYGQLVGWPVSTQRAMWMLTAGAFASLLGRSIAPHQLLGLAAVVILIRDPSAVGSLGFLLSFGAVLGILHWTPLFEGWLPQSPMPVRWLSKSISATAGATLGTLPVVSWAFQTLAVSAPIANLVAVPLLAGVAVPIGLAGLAFQSPMLVHSSDWAIDWTLNWLNKLDWGTLHPAVDGRGALVMVVAVMGTKKPIIAVLLLALSMVSLRTNRDMVVTFPDVGQGGAALIEFADGRTWLIDGGPPGHRVMQWLRRRGIRHVDAVFVSHPDIDHFGGLLPVIDALSIGRLWVPRPPHNGERTFHDLWLLAHKRGIPSGVFGQSAGANDNEEGLVIAVRNGRHSFLFSGDIGTTTEQRMAEKITPMSVVQVPHHGSRFSSSDEFIVSTDPVLAVIQSGTGNTYGHPHRSTVEAWGRNRVVQTSELGTVEFRTDGVYLTASNWTPTSGWSPLPMTRSRTPLTPF